MAFKQEYVEGLAVGVLTSVCFKCVSGQPLYFLYVILEEISKTFTISVDLIPVLQRQ